MQFTAPRLDRNDILLGIAVALFGVVALTFAFDADNASLSLPWLAAAVLGGASVAFRHLNPLVASGFAAGLRIVVAAETGNDIALFPAFAICLYALARSADRRSSLTLGSTIAIVSAVALARFDQEPFAAEFLGEAGLALLPLAIGDVVRARDERVQAVIEAETELRLQAERLRLARDLHDVVAHSLSGIAVQSGVAAHVIDRDPEQAREALATINTIGRDALDELREIVGALRTDPAPGRAPTARPLTRVAAIELQAKRLGVAASVSSSGDYPAEVADAVVVGVNRIIREALTNVARHAPGAATDVRLIRGPDAVSFEVRSMRPESSDIDPAGSTQTPGVGVVGMIERAKALGGTLSAGPIDDGGFLVKGTIPYGAS